MIALDAWALVRPSLPAAVAREVEESRPADLRAAVALVEPHLDSGRAWWLWRDALSSWAREQTDASDVLCALMLLDRRLGVWCACAVARTVLHYVLEGEHRPRVAIETAERWVIGKATEEECRDAASNYVVRGGGGKLHSAYDAALAAICAADAVYLGDAASAATYASYACSYAWYAALHVDKEEFCHVVADAVLTMPWEVPT